jgi:hypothetical protein
MRQQVTAILLIILVATGAEQHQKPTHGKDDCKGKSFGRWLQCIGSKYEAGEINDEVAKLWTHEALRALNSTETYYSLGIVWGRNTRVAVAKQDDFHFDWTADIPVKVYNKLSSDTLVLDNASDRPKLIYSRNSEDVQELPEWSNVKFTPELDQQMVPLYKLKGAKGGNLKEDCKKFENWNQKEIMKASKVAILMPSDMWCPSTATAAYDVYIADLELAGNKDGKTIWFTEWFRKGEEVFGEVPDWASELDF